jgi:ATP-dependent Clp protease ATP-binding subunit ClpA
MDSHYDEDCREALRSAQARARDFGHSFLGTEHLLLGLMERPGYVTRALQAHAVDIARLRQRIRTMMRADDGVEAVSVLGIDLDQVRTVAERTFGVGALNDPARPDVPVGHLPLTRRAKVALRSSAAAARRRDQRWIRPAHLLFGLLDEGGGIPNAALRAEHIDVVRLRDDVGADAGNAAD